MVLVTLVARSTLDEDTDRLGTVLLAGSTVAAQRPSVIGPAVKGVDWSGRRGPARYWVTTPHKPGRLDEDIGGAMLLVCPPGSQCVRCRPC